MPEVPEAAPPEPPRGTAGPATAGQRGSGSAEGVRHDAGIDAAEGRAGTSAENVGVGDVEVIARNGDVVVVLKRESYGIRKAEVNFAILDQIAEAHGVGKARLVYLRGHVGPDRVAKHRAGGFREIASRLAQRERLGTAPALRAG